MMKTIRTMMILFAAGVICLPATARLGETAGQNAKRYGKPLPSGGGVAPILAGADQEVFHFEGWQIVAAYVNGRTARIEYTKLRDDDRHDTVVIQTSDIEHLLESEKGDGAWEEIKKESTSNPFKAFARAMENETRWTNAVTGGEAVLRLNRMNLTFISPDAAAAASRPAPAF